MNTADEVKQTRSSQLSFVTRWLRRLLVIAAYGYPATLLLLCIAFRFVGENWWLTAGLLYVPRALFLLPLLLLLPALLWFSKRPRLLWTQALALLLCLFPLMGLVLPWRAPRAAGPTIEVLSLNVNSDYGGVDELMASLDQARPDVVLLQEAPQWSDELPRRLRAAFPHFEHAGQFIIASRFGILESTEPEVIRHFGRDRSPRFKRYLLDSPLGKLAVYNLHPISPRGAFGVHQMRGALHGIRQRTFLEEEATNDLAENALLRAAQVAAAAKMATREEHAVLLAGDTNLPGLSAVLHRHLGGFRDGFREASWGFGYTYSARHPLLRLDRILVGPELAFSEFTVGCHGVSDHLCVEARVFRR